jgi:RimJ/RimL family protein N-acetyltransferase
MSEDDDPRATPSALPFPDPPLDDETIALRPWAEPQLARLAAAGCDESIRRFRPVLPTTVDEARDWLTRSEAGRLRGDRLELAVLDPGQSELMGGVTLWGVNAKHRTAAINYWTAPAARGQGIAPAAVSLLAGWAFERMHLARLQLFVDSDNVASQRVALRAGFTREGLLRSHTEYNGRRHDAIVYGLLAEELA